MRLLCLVCHAKQLQIYCARLKALFNSLSAEVWLCIGLIQATRATELPPPTQKQSLQVVRKACKLSLFTVSRKKATTKCATRIQKIQTNLLCEARRVTFQTDRTFASGDELTQLINLKPSQSGVDPRMGITGLIQGLQLQIENQEVLKEFMALEHVKPTDDCRTGKAPENQNKNRYRDILPYDKTRVPLGEKNGYINASYIRMNVGEEEHFYIITQGPLPSTMADFWQMVWESESDVIAMMTKEVELGQVKCHQYWPEPPHDCKDLANFYLKLHSYQILEYFIIRKIQMINKQTEEKRIISHLQFTTWPDHNIPKLAEQLVKFICYMRKAHRTGPIVAHCSTGIGRSGVLLCVEILLSYIEKDLCFNIKQIVRDLRDQRFGMIQTKDEYLFCYEVVLEVLQILRAVDSY
ncbi:FERM and PDZ domain-containing protein 2 isoform X8 [Corvus kubaryi]|uniref:FERM and PDZ domain-containing protein 2 isoform X8 n=1 Tax=Corvus kubaryi TaxID=68294 RepID=UPI001C0578AE|nr:FERM and PDZ domain-containing protein 2 isoform X8 [Corvus kubaryi]XP_041874770.1 FERM and PDZ domain-containing protein 2 isoform X8 [Corvus kubaryi]